MNKLVNISELSKILDLVDPLTKKPLNHNLDIGKKLKKLNKKLIIAVTILTK